jgi:hypothetical protein
MYIFVSINEKEIEFNSRFYYFTRKMAKTASEIALAKMAKDMLPSHAQHNVR